VYLHSLRVLQPLLRSLLVGGVYCEVSDRRGLEFGSIIAWTYLRPTRSQKRHQCLHHLLLLKGGRTRSIRSSIRCRLISSIEGAIP